MKYLFFLVLVLAAGSCNMCKITQKHIHKHPECFPITADTVYIDSIIPGQEAQGEIQYITDSSAVDSLRKLLADCPNADSLLALVIPVTQKTISFLPINDSTSTYILKIWPGKKGAQYSLKILPTKAQIKIIKQKQIVPAPEKFNWWKVAFFVSCAWVAISWPLCWAYFNFKKQ